ncbi:MAG: hypothetical protein FWD54_01720 [Endomicrobia bacterium]|nr:hypothetical protein [Endomicrobiia bacterium]MCL2798988.1 hypothetical protein [Endomicrobiia bacterium]
MKKIFALAAILALFSSLSFAVDLSLPDVKFYGEGSAQGFILNGESESIGATSGYFTLGAAISFENITATLALGYQNYWGSYGIEGRHISGGGDGYLNLIRVVEANVNIDKLFNVDGLSAKVGRQYYGDEDSMVVYLGIRRGNPLLMFITSAAPGMISGPAGSVISSIEGASVYYEEGNIKANAVYAIGSSNNTGEDNMTIKGADFKYFNIADMNMFDFQAYLYNFENIDMGSGLKYYTILGVKPVFKMDNLKASLEFAKNFGGDLIFSNEYFNTNFVKFDVSYDFKDLNLTPRLSYFAGGSDNGDPFIAFGNYVPSMIFGAELSAFMGYPGIQLWNIGADYVYSKYTFGLDFFRFNQRDQADESMYEIDFIVKYAYAENITINFGIGNAFDDFDDNLNLTMVTTGITYKF